jgi:hypothetical protein
MTSASASATRRSVLNSPDWPSIRKTSPRPISGRSGLGESSGALRSFGSIKSCCSNTCARHRRPSQTNASECRSPKLGSTISVLSIRTATIFPGVTDGVA